MVAQAIKGGGTINVKGTYFVPREHQGLGKQRGAAVGSTPGFSYGATVAEVSVDQDTGQISVDKIWVAHDCGFAINPMSVEGQVQGGVWMGLAQAISEQTRYTNGLHMDANFIDYRFPSIVESPDMEDYVPGQTENLHDYLIPSIGDIPEIVPIIIEVKEPHGPFGAKEASEGALSSILAAVASAVRDAIGIEMNATPMTADRILAKLIAREKQAKRQQPRKQEAR